MKSLGSVEKNAHLPLLSFKFLSGWTPIKGAFQAQANQAQQKETRYPECSILAITDAVFEGLVQ